MIRDAFNFNKWLEEHRHELVPPVGNKNLYHESDDYIVMVVAGPNARKDYHYNETEEWFFQLEGHITVRIQEDGKPREVHLGPGDMFLCPAKTPHSPVREAGSVGAGGGVHATIQPPSTGSMAPVVKGESSPARKRMARAVSSGNSSAR